MWYSGQVDGYHGSGQYPATKSEVSRRRSAPVYALRVFGLMEVHELAGGRSVGADSSRADRKCGG